MRRRTSWRSWTTSKPSTRARPEVGWSRVVSIFMVVVLPAPLGPTMPKICPVRTLKLMPRTASISIRRRRKVPVLVR